MATPINSWSSDEVRAVIRFLNAKHVSPTEIHTQLVEVYGEHVMTKCHVYKWCKKFSDQAFQKTVPLTLYQMATLSNSVTLT